MSGLAHPPGLSRRALLTALAATACAPTPQTEAAPRADGLIAFHAALAQLRAGRRAHVAVLQIGDSHTANDAFSGRMRELMQARFGAAGRGFLPPAIPHAYYRPAQITVAAEGWRPIAAAHDADGGAPGPFGLALLRQRADGLARLDIRADQPGDLARIAVDALAQPGGGTIDLAFDTDQTGTLRTDGVAPWTEFAAPGAQSLVLTTRADGPVDLLGLRCLNGRPGVTWSNLGTIGATIAVTANWTPALVAREIRAIDPALIVLAFGTNEGFKDTTDPADYRALFASRLQALRTLAPAASILVALPPDGARRVHGTPGTCGNEPGIATPPTLGPVRAIQRDIAAGQGAAIWDWAAAMGGRCSIVPMTRTDPPQAAPDLVHMFKPGYRATAESLFATLMQGVG